MSRSLFAVVLLAALVFGCKKSDDAKKGSPSPTETGSAAKDPAAAKDPTTPTTPTGDGTGGDAILAKMGSFKDQVCACKDTACVEAAEKGMMEWAMANMEQMKDIKPTPAQDALADKIEAEMEKCKSALAPAAPPPAAPAPADPAAPAAPAPATP